MSKGEGAQAYGWGRYDAESKGVGKDYANSLADASYKGERLATPTTVEGSRARKLFHGYKTPDDAIASQKDTIKRFIDEGEDGIVEIEKATLKEMEQMLPHIKREAYLYKHDLPDEDAARYLDWDKPLSEQPESVRNALASAFHPDLANPGLEAFKNSPMTGGEAYRYVMGSNSNTQQAASEALGKAGIPGMKYLDGVSRYKYSLDDLKYRRDLKERAIKEVSEDPNKKIRLDELKGQLVDLNKDIDDYVPTSRNYVTWDQDVLNRMKLLERNGEVLP